MTTADAYRLPESFAGRILLQACREDRAAELIEALWAGGSATIDHSTGKLVIASAEHLDQMWNRPPEITTDESWRAEALKCRRIIKALPDCLTKTALQEIDMHLAVVLEDDAAVAEYRELVGRENDS